MSSMKIQSKKLFNSCFWGNKTFQEWAHEGTDGNNKMQKEEKG